MGRLKPWESKRRRLVSLARQVLYSKPESNAGVGWDDRKVPRITDSDDYETLQTVAEISALQNLLLDKPP